MPRPPRSFLRKVQRAQAMGWVSKRIPKRRAGGVGRGKRPPTLLRLADPQGLQLSQPPRSAQVLRVWENRPRGSRMLSSAEDVIPSPPMTRGRGRSSCQVWGWKGDIPVLSRVCQEVSTWEYHRSKKLMLPLITHRSNPSQMYIVALSIVSLWQGVTSARSHDVNWNGCWAPSSLPPCPLFLKR